MMIKGAFMLNLKKLTLTSAIIISMGFLTACDDDDNDNITTTIPDSNVSEDVEGCFWGGPYNIDNPKANFAYPDTGATYWHAKYMLPEDATLKLNGEYPYARYMSFNSYRAEDQSPAFALGDRDIKPNSGAINPFIPGAERNNENRGFQFEVAAGAAPVIPLDNVLYDDAAVGTEAILLYRVYVPNEGRDATGGVGLPDPELTLSSGEVLKGQNLCDTLQADQELIEIPVIPPDTYARFRQNNPAKENPTWRAVYNTPFSLRCGFLGQCDGNPVRQVPFYANLENQYIGTYIDRDIKPVAVIRGKIPTVPSTLQGSDIFDTDDTQLRYWSLCQNEYYSQKVTGCLYDEQVTINPDGYFTIATSLPEDRPSNVTDDCGVGYLPWSDQGDGFSIIEGRENNATDGLLILRNMLPDPNFDEAIQNTKVPGDEADVLGEFIPTVQYFTKAEFEALGCDAYKSLPQ
tara:strand:+ start:2401 stop:3783 length:1383 start_codon:yes stop_codon:yes gene_type:complete